MAGVYLEVELGSLDRLRRRIAKLAAMPLQRVLQAAATEVESQTRRRISVEKTGPDGRPWAPWSPAYAKTRHAGQGLLEGEGLLLASLTSLVEGDQARVGSNRVYAAIHQFGGTEVGKNIPARPYLGLSPDNERELLAVVEDYLDSLLEAA
jgi:phage virion morphogenesis protein